MPDATTESTCFPQTFPTTAFRPEIQTHYLLSAPAYYFQGSDIAFPGPAKQHGKFGPAGDAGISTILVEAILNFIFSRMPGVVYCQQADMVTGRQLGQPAADVIICFVGNRLDLHQGINDHQLGISVFSQPMLYFPQTAFPEPRPLDGID